MPKELRQKFSKAISIPIKIIPTTGSLDGVAIDTKVANSEFYDTALALIEIGNITGTPTRVHIKVEQDDDSNFTSVKSGTADEDIESHLMDSSNPFTAADVGKRVWNATDDTYANIIAFVDTGDVELDADVFPDGNEDYRIYNPADGGDGQTVVADHSYTLEIGRAKRYLRIAVITVAGTTPTVECFGALLLWGASKPFPLMSAADIDNS